MPLPLAVSKIVCKIVSETLPLTYIYGIIICLLGLDRNWLCWQRRIKSLQRVCEASYPVTLSSIVLQTDCMHESGRLGLTATLVLPRWNVRTS